MRWHVAFWLLIAPVAAAHAASTEPSDMASKVLACAPCHGALGQGVDNPYFPRLAGKPEGYLLNQLIAFRNGRRRYPPMNYLLEYQEPDYLAKMAAFFAAARPPARPPATPSASEAVLDAGRSIVANGLPAQGVPACSACHGQTLTGMNPGIPGLVGLRADYISAQLGAWRYGTRTAIAPDCMQMVAARLTEANVTAVASWLAAQPVPADPSPAPAGSYVTALACGSEPQ